MAAAIDRVCPVCARAFVALLRQVRRGRGIHCSGRCAAIGNARIGHARHPRLGAANPNFKGWRSRDNVYYKDRFRAKHPEKAAAHDAVSRAERQGRLHRPAACQRCGIIGKTHAHHDDYAQPLQVLFVCRPCHRVLDAARREREAADVLRKVS